MAADERVARLEERTARVEQRVTNHGEELDSLKQRLDGPPREDSLSGRIHRLESDAVAATAAKAALEEVRKLRTEQSDRQWSRGDKIAATLIGVAIAVGPWLVPLAYHHHT